MTKPQNAAAAVAASNATNKKTLLRSNEKKRKLYYKIIFIQLTYVCLNLWMDVQMFGLNKTYVIHHHPTQSTSNDVDAVNYVGYCRCCCCLASSVDY